MVADQAKTSNELSTLLDECAFDSTRRTSFSTVSRRRGSCLAASPPLYRMATTFIPLVDCLLKDDALRRPVWKAAERARANMAVASEAWWAICKVSAYGKDA